MRIITGHLDSGIHPAADAICEARAALLTELSTGLAALRRAHSVVEELRQLDDVELVDSPEYDDAVAFLADSQRNTRAAHAIIHAIIDHQTP